MNGSIQVSATDAERQRRRRARARRREIVCPVPIGEQVINKLCGLHWLDEHEAEDRTRIGNAIAAMLLDLAESK
jgi:hypothetical protein